jgi:zinc D-Ala-D-Ala carboxypeptidase
MNPLTLFWLLVPLWLSPPHFEVREFDVHVLKAHHTQTMMHTQRTHYFFNHKNPFHEDYTPSSTLHIIHQEMNDITILVNRFYTLPSTYVPSDLVDLKSLDSSHPSATLREEAAQAFMKLRQAVKHDLGITIEARSAYRSYQTQERLFNRYAQKDGFLKANTYSALPGQSEHQTGLAFDASEYHDSYLNFKASKAYPYLKEHAFKFGFIERYPQSASHITGYIYEPWHWRYVGVELATTLHQESLTLDEFVLNSLN